MRPEFPCAREPEPPFPVLGARPCGPDICLSPEAAGALVEYARAVHRAFEMNSICLDVSEIP